MTTDGERGSESVASDDGTETEAGAMRARRWCIAATFRDPTDYDVPELLEWTVDRDEDGTLAFGQGGERFLSAGSPARVHP